MPRGVKKKPNYTIEPWTRVCRNGKWEIEAFSPATGKKEVIAEIRPNCGFSPDRLAEFVVATVNALENREQLIRQMSVALEMCLERDNLDWSAEHDAEVALRRAKSKG